MIFRIICLVLFSLRVCGHTFNGAPLQAMGNTGLAAESIYSITNNAAGIANLSKLTAAIAYQPHFMSGKLRTQAMYIAVPTRRIGTLGWSIRNYGIAQVSSFLTSSLVYGRSFGGIIATSFSANYHRYTVRDYMGDHTFSLDLGAQVTFSESVRIGLLVRNATISKFKDDTEQYLPVEGGAGFWYKISEELSLSSDAYYEQHRGFNLRGGVAYSIANVVCLRAGASSDPMQYHGGVGIQWGSFQFDVSSSFHSRLGSSPQFALAYAF